MVASRSSPTGTLQVIDLIFLLFLNNLYILKLTKNFLNYYCKVVDCGGGGVLQSSCPIHLAPVNIIIFFLFQYDHTYSKSFLFQLSSAHNVHMYGYGTIRRIIVVWWQQWCGATLDWSSEWVQICFCFIFSKKKKLFFNWHYCSFYHYQSLFWVLFIVYIHSSHYILNITRLLCDRRCVGCSSGVCTVVATAHATANLSSWHQCGCTVGQ